MQNDYYNSFKENVHDTLIKVINENIINNKYNVLLFHSPILLYKDKVLGNIKNIDKIDLVLSGHMHNGLVPLILDFSKNKFGLISPKKKLIARFSRNMKEYNNTKLIILYPLTFYYKLEKLNIEHLYRPGYTLINIEK